MSKKDLFNWLSLTVGSVMAVWSGGICGAMTGHTLKTVSAAVIAPAPVPVETTIKQAFVFTSTNPNQTLFK